MVSSFFSGEYGFELKRVAEGVLLDVHLKKYTIQNIFLPTFMISESPCFGDALDLMALFTR